MKLNNEWNVWDEITKHKRLYLKTSFISLLCSFIISVSIPSQYVSRTVIVPETKFLELNIGGTKGLLSKALKEKSAWSEADIDLYRDILKTNDFRNSIKNLHVVSSDSIFQGTYGEYLKYHSGRSWLYKLFASNILDDIIDENVKYSLNRKFKTFTIQVCACDPHVAATLPSKIKALLQKKIQERYKNINVSMSKSLESMIITASSDYNDKLKNYNNYKDSHLGIKDKTYLTVQTALQRDARLAKEYYEHLITLQKRMDMNIQKNDIYFTTLIHPAIAQSPTHPRYVVNALIWLFYSLVFTTFFISYRKKLIFQVKKRDNHG